MVTSYFATAGSAATSLILVGLPVLESAGEHLLAEIFGCRSFFVKVTDPALLKRNDRSF
ncbi:hypothetical protein NC653_034645 [Populus alba x Populus x berolinensis]|uniref:Uncharacterized protein n=1 Tax=Populus alba x Populus x berolinensis TaxID=444605 RepID=A0AAD6PXD3_9ROSI|nr:hypothetical protein NC653_034645 [Populus alba x Populus x berolinensis]